jgi:hypothetical protein
MTVILICDHTFGVSVRMTVLDYDWRVFLVMWICVISGDVSEFEIVNDGLGKGRFDSDYQFGLAI